MLITSYPIEKICYSIHINILNHIFINVILRISGLCFLFLPFRWPMCKTCNLCLAFFTYYQNMQGGNPLVGQFRNRIISEILIVKFYYICKINSFITGSKGNFFPNELRYNGLPEDLLTVLLYNACRKKW